MRDLVHSVGTERYCGWAIPARNSAPDAIMSVVVAHSRHFAASAVHCELVAGMIDGTVQIAAAAAAAVSHGIDSVC